MKRFIALTFTVLAVFAGGGSARSSGATCSVSPDPVRSLPYPQTYSYFVSVQGAVANTDYDIWVSEPHNNQITQQHPASFVVTDASGAGTAQLNGNDPTHVLQPGTVSVKITTTGGGGRIAVCSFNVT